MALKSTETHGGYSTGIVYVIRDLLRLRSILTLFVKNKCLTFLKDGCRLRCALLSNYLGCWWEDKMGKNNQVGLNASQQCQ